MRKPSSNTTTAATEMNKNKDVTPDEETPLLRTEASDRETVPAKPTPLPKLQLTLLLSTCLAEPFSATVVQPFINQVLNFKLLSVSPTPDANVCR